MEKIARLDTFSPKTESLAMSLLKELRDDKLKPYKDEIDMQVVGISAFVNKEKMNGIIDRFYTSERKEIGREYFLNKHALSKDGQPITKEELKVIACKFGYILNGDENLPRVGIVSHQHPKHNIQEITWLKPEGSYWVPA